jgi:hypothetical protein
LCFAWIEGYPKSLENIGAVPSVDIGSLFSLSFDWSAINSSGKLVLRQPALVIVGGLSADLGQGNATTVLSSTRSSAPARLRQKLDTAAIDDAIRGLDFVPQFAAMSPQVAWGRAAGRVR